MPWLLLSIGFMAPPPATATGAVQAYEHGHISQAYTLSKSILADPNLPSEDQETALLVEAFALLRMGRLNESQASLEALKASKLDLGPYLDLLRIQAATGSGRCAEALQMGRDIPNDSVFATKAWSQVVECALRAHDKDLCAQSLEAMAPAAQDDTEQAALALMKARYAELQGDKLQARDRLRDLLINFPFSPAAKLARNYLNTLARHGVTVTPLDPEELLPRAEGERVASHNDVARHTYRNVLRQSTRHHGGDEVQNLAQLGLVQLDISEQHYSQARSRLNPILRRTNDSEIKAQAMFLDGDLLARRGKVNDAIRVWEQCVSEHADQPFARVAGHQCGAARLRYPRHRRGPQRCPVVASPAAQRAGNCLRPRRRGGRQQPQRCQPARPSPVALGLDRPQDRRARSYGGWLPGANRPARSPGGSFTVLARAHQPGRQRHRRRRGVHAHPRARVAHFFVRADGLRCSQPRQSSLWRAAGYHRQQLSGQRRRPRADERARGISKRRWRFSNTACAQKHVTCCGSCPSSACPRPTAASPPTCIEAVAMCDAPQCCRARPWNDAATTPILP